MKFTRLSPLLLFISPSFAQAPPHTESALAPEPQLASAPVGAMVVYVSDFDLDVLNVKRQQRLVPRTPSRSVSRSSSASSAASSATGRKATSPAQPSGASQAGSGSDDSVEETPADRANALINAVSETLIHALRQAGYDARRLTAGSPLPKAGLRLRGVFAEADERNRARRLLVGGEPVGAKMILFVGVNNLARPEQPLYELADPPAPDPRHGPVITVTSYAPAARFELSREASDDELKKISANIASSLTALVNANRLSLAQ